jgi:hypothetical protein
LDNLFEQNSSLVIEKSAASAQWLDWIDLTSHSLDGKLLVISLPFGRVIGTCI